MNNVVLVGRLTDDPKVTNTPNGKPVISISVAVTRNYKNSDGIYETDFVRCILWDGIAENTSEYCHCGDVIGVKGRLQSSYYDDENGKRHFVTDVVAERVTFLTTAKVKDAVEEVKKDDKKSSKNSKKAE